MEEKCGYVVWKDRSTVEFYCNGLASTLMALVMKLCPNYFQCAHDMAKIRRWLGHESMHLSLVEVPPILTAYNLFMNGIDCFDQLRASNSTEQNEMHVTVHVFTFWLDASVINAYAVYRTMKYGKQVM